MFLRKNIKEKDGKRHVYWTLVETFRTPKGPRQRIVSYLGDLNEESQEGYKTLASNLNGEATKQLELFEVIKPVAAISIYPERIRVERVRDFGNVWLGCSLWRILELDKFFERRIDKGREAVRWSDMICYSVVSQFCDPTSELAIAERTSQQNALCDILGIKDYQINDDRLYRTLDRLLEHKDKLSEHLKIRYGELFGIEYDILLYDITSTYFEGKCKINPQAKRGYSRDKRSDCKQVTIALIVTKDGFPLNFEVFDGNRADVTTVKEIVQKIESTYGQAQGIWVMDRGMVSEENLRWLRERGASYLVGTPKSMLKKFEQQLLEQNWREVEPGVGVKLVACPDGSDEVFVLCRSADRKKKEDAIFNLFVVRIEEGLLKLQEATSRTKHPLRDRDHLQRKIGALLKANSRAARLFDVQVETIEDGKKVLQRLSWTKKESLKDWVEIATGCYLLRTNISSQLSSEEIWKAYIGLTEIENSFRILKSDLGLRPIWHHKEERVQAHIFVCFLALVIKRVFEHALAKANLGRSTTKVIEEFRSVKSMDLILPTTNGTEVKLKIISEPEQSLRILMQHANIEIPRRLQQYKQYLL